jgi:hypothetical protein
MLLTKPSLLDTQKMQNNRNQHRLPPPVLKPRPQQQDHIQEPHGLPTLAECQDGNVRETFSLTRRKLREKVSLSQVVDYDKLTPTQQARWDLGIYGTIELKKIKQWEYYYLRWRDDKGTQKSTYLGKDWNKAIDKVKQLTGCYDDDSKQLELHSLR